MGRLLIKMFIKDYENIKDPVVREKYGKLAGLVGILSNAFLCTIKIFTGILVNSIAILADGINNLSDASSSIITLIGFKLASMPEDEEHPYGHARIEYLTGLLVSVIIIILGIELLKTSIEKIMHPLPLEFNSIRVKVWQAFFNISLGKRINSITLIATGTDSRNDVITTTVVLLGIIIGKLTGFQLDGILGCVVALFIIWSGIQLIRDTSSPLLGEAPSPELVQSICHYAEAYPHILGMHDLVVHDYGPGRIFASFHAEVDADGDLMASHDTIDNLENLISEELNIHIVIHMDPIKVNDPTTNYLYSYIKEIIESLDGVNGMHDLRIVPGPTHTNVIFDLVIGMDCKMSQSMIHDIIEENVRKLDVKYCVVITFDKGYTKID